MILMETLSETKEKIRILREFHENAVAANELCASDTKYRELFIAVCDRKVVASGSTEDEMQKNIPAEYRERPDLFVRNPLETFIIYSTGVAATAAYA